MEYTYLLLACNLVMDIVDFSPSVTNLTPVGSGLPCCYCHGFWLSLCLSRWCFCGNFTVCQKEKGFSLSLERVFPFSLSGSGCKFRWEQTHNALSRNARADHRVYLLVCPPPRLAFCLPFFLSDSPSYFALLSFTCCALPYIGH